MVPGGHYNTVGALLEAVYYYGQNDFAIGPELNTTYSLSVADVIELEDGRLFMVASCGFKEITKERFAALASMSSRDRVFAG